MSHITSALPSALHCPLSFCWSHPTLYAQALRLAPSWLPSAALSLLAAADAAAQYSLALAATGELHPLLQPSTGRWVAEVLGLDQWATAGELLMALARPAGMLAAIATFRCEGWAGRAGMGVVLCKPPPKQLEAACGM